MVKLLKNKYFVLAVIIAVVLVVSGNNYKQTLLDRSMIVGMAIDYVDDEEIEVSAQFVVPIGSSDSGGNTNYSTVKARGKTILEVFYRFQNKTGQLPSLAHCRAVIVSRELMEKRDFTPIAEFLIKNTKITEDTPLVCSEGRAEEILIEDSNDLVRAEAINKEIFSNKKLSTGVSGKLADYYISRFDEEKFFAMPYVRFTDETDETGTGTEKPTESKQKVVSVTETALIGKRLSAILTRDETIALNLVVKSFNKGAIELDEDTSYEIMKKSGGADVEADGTSVKVSVKVKLELLALKDVNAIRDGKEKDRQNAENADKLKARYEEDIKKVFEKATASGVDAFGVRAKLHASLRDGVKEYGEYLKNCTLDVKIDVKII